MNIDDLVECENQIDWLKDEIIIAKLQRNQKAVIELEMELKAVQEKMD